MSMSSLNHKLEVLEPLAANYISSNKTLNLTPVLAGAIFCGVTWGVLGLQYVKWLARGTKGQSLSSTILASYLMVCSTGYLAFLTMFISYFFAYNFGRFSAAFDMTYPSWLFLLATVLIHVPCQYFYAQNAYTLSGQKRLLGLIFFALIVGTVGVGVTLKVMLPRIVVNITWLQGFLIKLWIAMTTATDLVLSVSIAWLQLRGKSHRYSSASGFWHKFKLLVVDAQLPATVVSVGLLVVLMINPASPFTHLWLGLPLVYPINVMSTLSAKKSLREDIEAEADRRSSAGSVTDEKPHIPPAEHRPSFLLSPFPTIAIRRASVKFGEIASPIITPAMNGVRRASQLLGAMPPLARHPSKKRTFPFKPRSGARSPVELHPSSLGFPLSANGAPMGASELVPRGKALERAHSLAPLDTQPELLISLGQATALPPSPGSDSSGSTTRQPRLENPFSMSARSSRSPSPRPTIEEALEAHMIFEMPATPTMMSPKSSHSPMMLSPGEVNTPEWR